MTPDFSAFPPSFGGSLLLYTWALGSITALAVVMSMIAGWMARDIWRDRYAVYLTTPVQCYRITILLASFTGFVRSMPEAVYLYSWNEVRPDQWALILTIKRLADGMSIFPGMAWTILFALTYPGICHACKTNSIYVQTDLLSPWPKLARPALALTIAFVIAFLVAISKLYLGVHGGAS